MNNGEALSSNEYKASSLELEATVVRQGCSSALSIEMSVDPDKLYIVHSKPKHDSHSDAIRHFEGDFECLSNTYKCPVSLRGDSEPYPSVEHALQASKTDDSELKGTIRQAKNAIEAKKLARVVKPTAEWRASSEKIVEALVRDKFRRNAKARGVLVGTGRVKLVYTNAHDDRFWGVCGGKGDNKLGKLLERVRADALAGKDTEAWCAMRFQLALPLDVLVDFAVAKAGQVVAEPSFEGKPIIRMGKLPDNEVVMAHPSISRSHALLVVDRKYGAFLIDLGASNGSFVDGRRLTPYVPEPIAAGGEGLTFAKSKRTYTLTRVETNLREAKKGQLYASMDPMASVAQPEPDSTIYMGNLDPSVTEDDLREFLAECGDISSIRIPQDKETGKMRGIAFVAFAKHSGVLHALTLHMDDLKGQSVKIRRADTPKPRDPTSSKKKQPPTQRQDAPSARPAPRAGHGGGGGGGSSDAAMQSAIEMATAAVIKAAEASRANAAAAAAAASADGGQGAPKRQKRSDRFGEAPAAGGPSEQKRGSRWGDSGEARGGRNGHDAPSTTTAPAPAAAVDGTTTNGEKRREEGDPRRRDRTGRESYGRGAGGGGGLREGEGRGDRGESSDRDHRDGGRRRRGGQEDAGRRDDTGRHGTDGEDRRERRRTVDDDDEGRRRRGSSGERGAHGDRSGGGGGGGRDGDRSRRGGHAGRDRADEGRRGERAERTSRKSGGRDGGDDRQEEGRRHRDASRDGGRKRRDAGEEDRRSGDKNQSRDRRREEGRDRQNRRSTARSRSRSRSRRR